MSCCDKWHPVRDASEGWRLGRQGVQIREYCSPATSLWRRPGRPPPPPPREGGRPGGRSGPAAVEQHCPLQAPLTQHRTAGQPCSCHRNRNPGWAGGPPIRTTPFPRPRLPLRKARAPLGLGSTGVPGAWASPLLGKLLQVPLNPPVQRVEAFDVQQVQHLHLEGFVQKTALR